jgi:type I restriction enzyme M protein
MTTNFSSIAAHIWSVADLLRGDFKQSKYGNIILPFALLRRLECVLESTKDSVIAKYEQTSSMEEGAQAKILLHTAGLSFYNTSKMDLSKLGETDVRANLENYIRSFSQNTLEIFEHFDFFNTLDKLEEANLLYLVTKRYATTDLHPSTVTNHEMGLIFEELIRRFSESANETAGEHFTPRDIVRLTTSLVFCNDDDVLTKPGSIRSIYDPTAGTGGFLSSGMEYMHEMNEKADIRAFGQELNPESYAICKADMLIKGQKVDNIKLGNTLSDDQLGGEKFDYMLSNPPFGVDWKKVQKKINDEKTDRGFDGRFGPGLPRVSDGSLLFLLHLISKMKDKNKDDGSRIGIILNGSPLFTGGAGSGESEIRRYVLENDLLEAIVALPTDMFYNTSIATYVWVLSTNKETQRKGKVQLINAAVDDKKDPSKNFYASMRKCLGSKRRLLTEKSIDTIVKTYGQFVENENSKVFDYTDFGYRRITIERPLKLALYPKDAERLEVLRADKAWEKLDTSLQTAIEGALARFTSDKIMSRDTFINELKAKLGSTKLSAGQMKMICKHLSEHDDDAEVCKTAKGDVEANSDLRDYENVPLKEDIKTYFKREVIPHVPDAWIDEGKKDEQDGNVGIIGYEIPFNRHFYVYQPPRDLETIDAELDLITQDIMSLLQEVHV